MNLFQLFESKELATELIWFRRFISENDLETEIEVEGEPVIATSALQSRWYTQCVLKGPFKLGEPVIATDAFQSKLYKDFLATLK